MATTTVTEIYSRYYTNGTSNSDFTAATDGHYTAAGRGFGNANYYDTTVIKFVLNSPAEKLSFGLSHRNENGSDAVLNYKFVSSVDYSATSSLNSAKNTTSGDGTITLTGGDGGWYSTIYEFEGSFSTGVWYLYLWTNVDNSTNWCRIRHTVDNPIQLTYEEAQGLIHIDNGSGWDAYEVYIDNGSSWDRYIPYIDNGSSWDMIG